MHPKYDYQVIIMLPDCRENAAFWTSMVMQARWQAKSGDVGNSVIYWLDKSFDGGHGYDLETLKRVLSRITHKSRIYICGHGQSGNDKMTGYIADDKKVAISAVKLARLLAQNMPATVKSTNPQLPGQDQSSKLRISLLSCYAGLPSNNEPVVDRIPNRINNSFAATFHAHFMQQQINCSVAARTKIFIISPTIQEKYVASAMGQENYYSERRKQTSPITPEDDRALMKKHFEPKHDNRSKVIYDSYKGQQVIKTAYADPWRSEVFTTLNHRMVDTPSMAKKNNLAKLINSLLLLTNQEIQQKLMLTHQAPIELQASHSIHEFGRFPVLNQMLGRTPKTATAMQQLIANFSSSAAID